MKRFDEMPKSVKKTIRYINQDAQIEDLARIKQLVNQAITKRKQFLISQK
ncbi:hypothetical protein [Priestia aryabhattai]|nr:hypothetical protein [Priestia aryabhattai]